MIHDLIAVPFVGQFVATALTTVGFMSILRRRSRYIAVRYMTVQGLGVTLLLIAISLSVRRVTLIMEELDMGRFAIVGSVVVPLSVAAFSCATAILFFDMIHRSLDLPDGFEKNLVGDGGESRAA